MSISHVLCSPVWGDPERMVTGPTTRVFNGSRHVTVLQYYKLYWLLRGFLRFIVSVEDCKLYENSESGRRKLPLLVWTNDFPFILQAHTVFTFEEGICRSLNLSRTLTEFVSNLTHFSHCLINEKYSTANDKISSLLSLTASRNSRCLTRTIRVLCTNDTQMAEVVVVLSILNYNILRLRCHATRLLVFSFKLHLIDPWFWPKAGNIGLLFVCPLLKFTFIHIILL